MKGYDEIRSVAERLLQAWWSRAAPHPFRAATQLYSYPESCRSRIETKAVQ